MRLSASDLYKVQTSAIALAYGLPGFAYFLEMGLGKTRTVLYEFNWLVEDGLADFLIVACPKSLIGSWRVEAEELGYPYPLIAISVKTKIPDLIKEIKKHKGPMCFVVNYEGFLNDSSRGSLILDFLMSIGRVYIALDESIRIKNKDSKIGKQLYSRFKGALGEGHFRRVLSGRTGAAGTP